MLRLFPRFSLWSFIVMKKLLPPLICNLFTRFFSFRFRQPSLLILLLIFQATFLYLDVTAFCKSLLRSSFVRQYKLVILSASVTLFFELCSDVISLLSFVWDELLYILISIFFTRSIRSFSKANNFGTCFGPQKDFCPCFSKFLF